MRRIDLRTRRDGLALPELLHEACPVGLLASLLSPSVVRSPRRFCCVALLRLALASTETLSLMGMPAIAPPYVSASATISNAMAVRGDDRVLRARAR
jgi:hypothetical protein